MKSVSSLLKVYQDPLSDKIRLLAAPLDICFGIDEFIYTYISSQGEYFALSNQPEPSEYYFCNNLFLSNPLIRHPDNYQNGPLLPGMIPGKKQEEVIGEKFGYQVNTSLVIFKKDKKGVHKFLFNTKKHGASILSFYVNNLSLLDAFCGYFLEEWKSNKMVMEKYTIDMASLIGSNFFKMSYLGQFQNWNNEMSRKESFFKKIGMLREEFTLPKKFSAQENVCIDLLLQGKNSKEISEVMNLSYRTVEHYIENIKNKMDCISRSEVIGQLHALKKLGIV